MTTYENPSSTVLEGLEVVSRDALSVSDPAITTQSMTRTELDFLLSEVDRNADGWWKRCAFSAVKYMAELGNPFTAHDVAALGVPEPDHPARWGALFNTAARAGIIRIVAIVPSSRPTVHRGLVRLWVGAAHIGGEVR